MADKTKKVSGINGQVSKETQAAYDAANAGYQQSQAVAAAQANLQNALAMKPGGFTSQYEGQMANIYNNLMNRDPFSYNFNADALYKQYANNYANQAKMAQNQSVAMASGLTGGYGNSYAQIAGQQAYQGAIDQINNVIPELYQIAYGKYQDEGSTLLNQLQMVNNMYQNDYQKYRDDMSDYRADRLFAQNAYESERNFDYNRFNTDRNAANNAYWNEKEASQYSTAPASSSSNGAKAKKEKYIGNQNEKGQYNRSLSDYETAIWMRSVAMGKNGGKATDAQIVKNLWKAYENGDFDEGDLLHIAEALGVTDKL